MLKEEVDYLSGPRRMQEDITVRGLDGVVRVKYQMCCLCKTNLPMHMFRYLASTGDTVRKECIDCYDVRAKGYTYGETYDLEKNRFHFTKIDTRKSRYQQPKIRKGVVTNSLEEFLSDTKTGE